MWSGITAQSGKASLTSAQAGADPSVHGRRHCMHCLHVAGQGILPEDGNKSGLNDDGSYRQQEGSEQDQFAQCYEAVNHSATKTPCWS